MKTVNGERSRTAVFGGGSPYQTLRVATGHGFWCI